MKIIDYDGSGRALSETIDDLYKLMITEMVKKSRTKNNIKPIFYE
jgi:hypothetical protein